MLSLASPRSVRTTSIFRVSPRGAHFQGMTANNSALEPLSHYPLNPGSQMISWSKNGFICYATPASQGHNLNMTYLENTNGSNWQLAASHQYSIKPTANGFIPDLQVVSWNTPSTDLAIFDEHGNFYVLMAGVRMLSKKKDSPDSTLVGKSKDHSGSDFRSNTNVLAASSRNAQESESPSYELASYNRVEIIYRDVNSPQHPSSTHGRCVAFEWLGIDKPQVINRSAKLSEDGSSYTYGIHSYQPPLLAHPLTSKHACVALRENGEFCLYHQGEHKLEYHKVSTKLEPNGVDSELYFTHASIGFTSDKKVVVTAFEAISRKIYTYSISVDWGYLVEAASKQKSDPLYYTPSGQQTPPSLGVFLLHEMSSLASGYVNANVQKRKTIFSERRLSSIDLISPCHLPNSDLDILITYETRSSDGSWVSTVNRFCVTEASSNLNDPFSSMIETKASKDDFHTLTFRDKIVIPHRLESVKTAIFGSVIVLINNSGTITTVNRIDWSITFPMAAFKNDSEPSEDFVNKKPKTISSFLDCGFGAKPLPVDYGPFAFATSPNLAGMVHLRIGAKKPAVFCLFELESKSLDTTLLSSAFSHSHANACYSNISSDDLMALFSAQYGSIDDPKHQKLIEKTIVESHSAINFQLNSFSKESVDKLLSNPPLQKLLSLQLTLSELGKRRIPGEVASTSLSLRSTSLAMMFTLSTIYRQMSKKKPTEDSMEDSVNRAECIISLVGTVKWYIDLLIYLNQELLQLSYAKNNSCQSIISIKNSVVMPLLLSRVPRLFLMYAIGSIGRTHETLKKLHNDLSESNKLFTPMKEALERFFNTSNYSPLKLTVFESFLRECDDCISKELSSGSVDRANSLRLEQQLFCEGVLPNQILPVANMIIDKFSAGTSRDSRLSSLYFYDSRWLQIGATRNASLDCSDVKHKFPYPTYVRHQYSQSEAIDALRKIFISCHSPLISGGATQMDRHFDSTQNLKKCVRCRSVSLVADPLAFDLPKTIGLWTMVFHRNCICGSAWVNCETGDNLLLLK